MSSAGWKLELTVNDQSWTMHTASRKELDEMLANLISFYGNSQDLRATLRISEVPAQKNLRAVARAAPVALVLLVMFFLGGFHLGEKKRDSEEPLYLSTQCTVELAPGEEITVMREGALFEPALRAFHAMRHCAVKKDDDMPSILTLGNAKEVGDIELQKSESREPPQLPAF